MLARKALAGTAGTPKLYVEDVFSTYLYTGNGSTQTITNNIDLSGKGGLVWCKARSQPYWHELVDTVRGIGSSGRLSSNATNAGMTGDVTGFTSSGFTLGYVSGNINESSSTNVSWTFRKAEKFFDVVTYTGNGNAGRAISHNLGSTPGFIIIKRTDSTSNWFTAHRSVSGQGVALNSTDGVDGTYYALNTNSSDATSTTVTVSATRTNVNGASYVMYLFAHNAGGFGDAGDQNVISCGSFTTDGSGNATITGLGYEPQFAIVKSTDFANSWYLFDNIRGWSIPTTSYLRANLDNAEVSSTFSNPTTDGFTFNYGTGGENKTFIYIAIRRGPMKTPTTGTSVFETDAAGNNAAAGALAFSAGFPVDWYVRGDRSGSNKFYGFTRLTGNQYLTTTSTAAGATTTYGDQFDSMTGIETTDSVDFTGQCGWLFRRAPGFFDVVCYTGTGSARTVSHNLGVAPELVILKRRNSAEDWPVLQANIPTQATLNGTFSGDPPNSSYFGNGTSYVAPTSTVFSVGTNSAVNASGGTYVAYLFASLSGVSKIGSYTGNGSSVTVTTNFQPRFILVKRTDSTGNWIVGDSARGLPTGNDPALFLNATDAETTGQDWVDVSSTGFTVNETALNANVNTGTYIYLAIA